MDFLVGTFRHSILYTLNFTPPSTLTVKHTSQASGGHSWLTLSPCHKFLYTTVWSDPPSVSAYKINKDHTVMLLNTKPIKSLSGYVCTTASGSHLISAGGPSGEVFSINDDGSLGELAQELSFRKAEELNDGERKGVAHGSFGGLRHGSHSVDLSPDGKVAWVADIGHNCVWAFGVQDSVVEGDGAVVQGKGPLDYRGKFEAPRKGDGPRHAWPHPNGKILYSLQEHSCMVDIFENSSDGKRLKWKQGVRIIPEGKDPKAYWADEVRVSRTQDGKPQYMYASTRGLDKETMGYVAAFRLDADGLVVGEALDIYQTATSGGLANAVEPAPATLNTDNTEYLALTDSEEGFVFILSFDGKKLWEVARVQLKLDSGDDAGAATAVWLP
ncbi:Lactonase-like protein 2 [Elsinoe fawcettii]|nr:Lactonase-like protein 2 [Elsinoe fawcettii]